MFSQSLLRSAQASRFLASRLGAQTARFSTHTTDSYSKDVDSTPAADPKIHRVDPSSENVQKPHEPPSGQWSATGVEAGEYASMSGDEPYGAPGEEAAGRYGGKSGYQGEKAQNPRETTQSTEEQGPQGAESGGRKPEGR
ncbi:hypothetical protein B0H15DRAFT_777209 [Mycena belliarum]|uniref:Uncharacterized protein n=1 Tax=Mycena belliarum TaxID=1033014 RepID=A0AAD6UBU9_9AGAR|nr:hypothetical protein B0H15DRAFT_777209 [Mycena belliae]